MKGSYGEGIANHTGPESRWGVRKGVNRALTGVRAGWVLSREMLIGQGTDGVPTYGRQHRFHRYGKMGLDPARSETPWHARKHCAREPGNPALVCEQTSRPYREV